jgi:hypothetical protein
VAPKALALSLLLPSAFAATAVPGRAQQPAQAEPERQALDGVWDWGGQVYRDERAAGKPVTGVSFFGPVADEALAPLRALGSLQFLHLGDAAGVTDAGLAHLGGLTRLDSLDLSGGKVRGPGLAHLRGLSRLERLTLAGMPLDDAGLAHLPELPRLADLTLDRVPVTGPGLAHLRRLPRLESLTLSRAPLADDALARLPALPRLERLVLSEVPITDAGLAQLRKQPRLRFVRLSGTQVTEAGVAKLKGALPYGLVGADLPGERRRTGREGPTWFGPAAGAVVALGGGAALLLFLCPRGPAARRRRLGKLILVLTPVVLVGAGLLALAPAMAPVQDGDPATFWLHACAVDVGAPDPMHLGGFYQPRDGWFLYYDQGLHGQAVYRVREADALALFPAVARRLRDAPPGALFPDVERALPAWLRAGPGRADARGLLVQLREARLARVRQQDAGLYEYLAAEEDEFGERWGRARRYPLNVLFEFAWLGGLVLFGAWPWLRGSGRLAWATHLALVPPLFFLPYWLGYAQLTFTSRGPSGGVLYPWLLARCRGLPCTGLDAAVLGQVPPVLEPLSQTPGPMMVLTVFRGVGPVSVAGLALALWVLLFGGGEVVRRLGAGRRLRRPGRVRCAGGGGG